MPIPETMTVRVRDTDAEAQYWGHGLGRIIVRTITIGSRCPAITEEGTSCGALRGKPYGHNFHSDGEWANVDRWENPCGHIDYYPLVIQESKILTYAPPPEGT